MADVEMKDAAAGSAAKAKSASKSAKSGNAEGGADGKKRFEVKKVRLPHFRNSNACSDPNLIYLVERSCFVGVGYRR